MKNNLPISVGMLAWKAPKTLINTLQSYKSSGLLDIVDDFTIFFQEISQADRELAMTFGVKYIGAETNIGIGKAIEALCHNAESNTFLFAEDDWEVSTKFTSQVSLWRILYASRNLLRDGEFDFLRLRSNTNPGHPLYTLQFAGREMDSPEHLIEQVHTLGPGLATKFPDKVEYLDCDGLGFVCTDSFYGNYSNNPFMCKKDWWLEHVAPYSGVGVDLEGKVRDAWRSAGHKVAYSVPGIFTHNRLDR